MIFIFIGDGGQALGRDLQVDARLIERPGIQMHGPIIVVALEAHGDGRFARARKNVLDLPEYQAVKAKHQTELVEQLKQVEIGQQQVFLRRGARPGEPQAQGQVGSHRQSLTQGLLDFDLALVELMDFEQLLARLWRDRLGEMFGGQGGQVHGVQADQEGGVGIGGAGLLDGPRPSGQGDFVTDFEHVTGRTLRIKRGAVVLALPAAIVLGDGMDDGRQRGWRGEEFIADVQSEMSGEQGMVVLSDEKEVEALVAADHGCGVPFTSRSGKMQIWRVF